MTLKHSLSRIILPDSPSASSIPFVEYLKWLRYTRATPDTPHAIDIQTKSGCNAHCTFCPVGREENKIYGTMSDDLFRAIVDEVIEFPSLKTINPYLLNDPLVDKKLPEKIEYIARKRGGRKNPKVRIITNAGLLTEDMAYGLLHSEGLDEIVFSFHSIIPEVYERMMPPLRYDRVMGNILRLKDLWNNFQGRKPRLSVWTVKTSPVVSNLDNEKAYWQKVGIRFKARKLDNRANPNIEAKGLGDRPFEPVSICAIPFWRVWVMWNGDMVMCCVDQERTNLLGNCSDRPIREIWNDDVYRNLRLKWREKRLEGLLCSKCKGT